MKKFKRTVCFVLIFTIVASLMSLNVCAATKTFTITVKDSSGNALSGITVSMRNNQSISTQVNKTTNASGVATFTMYDNITYGFNVYDKNHNNAVVYSPNTYTTTSNVTGLTFTLLNASSTYPTYTNPLTLSDSISITSYYGYRYYGGLDLHVGTDIAAPGGTAIKNVVSAKYEDHALYNSTARGYWVLLKINSSRYVLYQHMQSAYSGTTSTTSSISAGTTIGYVGGTGGSNTYSNHLHIEFLTSSTMSASNTIDPLRFIYK